MGPAPETEPAQVSAARTAQSEGSWEVAARQWAEAASASTGSNAAKYQLYSADAWRQAGLIDRSQQVLSSVSASSLTDADRNQYYILSSELALEAGDAEQAEFFLQATSERLDNSLRTRYEAAQQALMVLRADPADRALITAAGEISELQGFDPVTSIAILQILEAVPSSRLLEASREPTRLGQWSALALSVRQTLVSQTDLLMAAEFWGTENPLHPIGTPEYMELCWRYGQYFSPPARIAVLVPQSGNVGTAGKAIRDGINAAYLDRPENSRLQFIPFGDSPQAALDAYLKAAAQGYDMAIGPLQRESVQLIVDQTDAPMPVMLLNTPEYNTDNSQNRFYSMSLSQTEEARAVARRMLEAGQMKAILLLAENDWGYRTESAFVDEYLAGEGEIVALERFSTSDSDHSQKLTTLLRIEASRQRKGRLQSALGIPLQFEASRRDDFEAFFMAADPKLGRQLKPQLKFYDSGGKAIYAMSRVFSGNINSSRDQDLNGVLFPATYGAFGDWEGTQLQSLSSLRNGALGSLHALGNDAWNILPWLPLMQKDPDLAFPGHSGVLRLDDNGQLLRDPVWARFRAGKPVPVVANGEL